MFLFRISVRICIFDFINNLRPEWFYTRMELLVDRWAPIVNRFFKLKGFNILYPKKWEMRPTKEC
ncbi:hypothetical protein BpHYR1_018119 [Brachionus plicatilis]|uniref:Uncharacterized protein n=1 Tax=Brachionus plicatilis TaxID=10195 RepID=A0A3M7PNY8_BRAPC|nr:hypothetical protein BpHYR1_018119 [Brachionus plicatilis]